MGVRILSRWDPAVWFIIAVGYLTSSTPGNQADFQLAAQAGAQFDISTQEDSYVVAKFRGVNVYYRVGVTMYNADYPEGLTHIRDGVTKFVRREIRTLREPDRNKVCRAQARICLNRT